MANLIVSILGHKVSGFLRKEILSAFLPGLMTLFFGYLLFSFPYGTHQSLALTLDRLGLAVIPITNFGKVAMVVVVLYAAYSLGYFCRNIMVRATVEWRRGDHYISELGKVKRCLDEVFGDRARRAFEPHGLDTIFEMHGDAHPLRRRLLGLRIARREAPMTQVAQKSDIRKVADDNNIKNRMEFHYCKTWLNAKCPTLSTNYFEYQINVVLALIAPILVATGFFVRYTDSIGFGRYWASLVGVAGLSLGIGMVFIARERQKYENFDTVRNFVFAHIMRMEDLELGVEDGTRERILSRVKSAFETAAHDLVRP